MQNRKPNRVSAFIDSQNGMAIIGVVFAIAGPALIMLAKYFGAA